MSELKIQFNNKGPSQEEETFNFLLGRIESLNESVAERKSLNERFNAMRNEELLPLLAKVRVLKIKQIITLDRIFNAHDFSKTEFRLIREEIIRQIEQVLEQFILGSEDESTLFGILAYHKGVSRDVIEEAYTRVVPEEFHDTAATEEEDPEKTVEELKLASLARKSLEQMTQSLRSIYIPLVKKLHPDREQDEEEKLKKTEVLKQLTEAYESKDLLSLLTLQSQYEAARDDNFVLNLNAYNKMLEEQVAALEEEYSALYNVLGGESSASDKSLKKLIKSRKKELNQYLTQEEQLLTIVYSIPENLVKYLK